MEEPSETKVVFRQWGVILLCSKLRRCEAAVSEKPERAIRPVRILNERERSRCAVFNKA